MVEQLRCVVAQPPLVRSGNIKRTGQASHAALPGRRRRFARTRIFWALCGVITLLVAVSVVMTSGVFREPHSPAPSSLPPVKPPTVPAAGMTPSPQSAPNNSATALAGDFEQLQHKLHGVMGLAVSAVGANPDPVPLGDWQSGPAWSTIKVPLTIAALREEDPPEVTNAMIAAIAESDNAAAESIWEKLGDPVIAAQQR